MSDGVVRTVSFGRDRSLFLVIGDLLVEPVDAIVNAANGHLAHGGGVAWAIAEAAGRDLLEDGNRIVAEGGMIPVGESVVTRSGNLPHKGVIHSVGPRLGQGDEERKLTRAVESSLECAHDRGWESVSFPAISSGIFRVPLEICARSYLAGVRAFWAAHAVTSEIGRAHV